MGDTTIPLWWAATGTELLTYLGHFAERSQVCALAWSPDGWRIASADIRGQIHIWDSNSQERVATCKGHEGVIHAVNWASDGKRLASAGNDGTVRTWNAATGKPLESWQYGGPIYALAWSPDGNMLASAGEEKVVRVVSLTR